MLMCRNTWFHCGRLSGQTLAHRLYSRDPGMQDRLVLSDFLNLAAVSRVFIGKLSTHFHNYVLAHTAEKRRC